MQIINFGLIGPGNIAKRVAKGIELANNAKLVAIGSRNLERAKEFAKKYDAKAYLNEDLLKDDSIDAVYLAIPNAYHYDFIKKALLANKHVICEKPLVVSAKQCQELFELAYQKNLVLMEAMKSDFLPLTYKIRKMIASGEYGKLLYLDGKYSSVTSGKPGSWVFDEKTGGGLRDVGIYPISYCNLIANSKIKKTTTITKDSDTGLDLLGQSVILYENGILATCTSGLELKTINAIYIYTDKGYFHIRDFWKSGHGEFIYNDGKVIEIDCEMENDFKYEVEHFASCIIDGLKESPIASYESTMEIIKVFDGRN